MLTDIQCRNATCPPGKNFYRLSDSGNLYLEVTKTGSKLWRWKYRFQGKYRTFALGRYPEVPLATPRRNSTSNSVAVPIKGARELRDEARAVLNTGVDPNAVRKQAKRSRGASESSTFQAVAERWWQSWKTNKAERHAARVKRMLELHVFPTVGASPVGGITRADVTRIVLAVESNGTGETARRVLDYVRMTLRYAVGHGLIGVNVASDIRPADFLKPIITKNHARVDYLELPDLLRKIDNYHGSPFTRLAMKLMNVTFVRTSELRLAQWKEFDFTINTWTIPSDREGRKGAQGERRPHIVPLVPQALAILEELKQVLGADKCVGEQLLFPGERNPKTPMSSNTILNAIKNMGYKGKQTGHGFRGIFSTASYEMNHEGQIIEAQLSHKESKKEKAAYNHAQWIEARRALLADIANFFDKVKACKDPIPYEHWRLHRSPTSFDESALISPSVQGAK